MTRFGIDAGVALRVVGERLAVPSHHRLVGPQVLRSDALSTLYRQVRAGELEADQGRDLLERLAALKIRLLGDRVSRATAWRIATDLGWPDTRAAEYLAVATLQADAFVTTDPELAHAAARVVRVAPLAELLE